MNIQDVELDDDLKLLWKRLIELHQRLRKHTRAQHARINPFMEDLFDWKEKGGYWGGQNVTIYDSTTITGNVKIGNNTWIGPFCSLDGGGGLSIGSCCSISVGVQLLSHDTAKWALSGGKLGYEYSPTKIGDCCFIGVHAVVAKGVSVGNHCLIGAGAVVTKDVSDFCIVAGVPAVVVGRVHISAKGNIDLVYAKSS